MSRGATQIGFEQVGLDEIGLDKIGRDKPDHDKITPDKVSSDHLGSRLVQIAVPPLDGLLTYRVPNTLTPAPSLGFQVEIPIGTRRTHGWIVGKTDASLLPDSVKIKDVSGVSSHIALFNEEQLRFFNWAAEYYGDSLSRVIDVAVPPRAPRRFSTAYTLLREPPTDLGSLQLRVCRAVKEHGGPLDRGVLLRKCKGAGNAVKRLVELEILACHSTEILDHHLDPANPADWAKRAVDLNATQQDAVHQIVSAARAGTFSPFLLHGVTGSGKTEVYIEAAQSVLADGGGVLVIVPEIALTPQLIERFRARLGNQIAVLHSALNRRARWDSWRALCEGRSAIAIGARSGVFAPVDRLRLIIVDEEHDGSYKQSDGFRYHARDLAVVRAQQNSCPVVLGSATPSLESYQRALDKKYHFISLPARHGTSIPLAIELVDLSQMKPWELVSKNISPTLHQALAATVARGEQSFVLYNRRGFASYLQCEECQFTCECPNCSVTLTYYQRAHKLLCHYCSHSIIAPTYCPECQRKPPSEAGKDPPRLVQRGAGTEKIFDEIRELFPTAIVDRLDRDAVGDAESYRAVLDRLRSGQTQILVGTQMIAKGHDLPEVTLVGVADCDVGLHMPDFRASERIFQLLTQVAGRAGRGSRSGRVILQTRLPTHPSIVYTLSQNYTAFARHALSERRGLNYPPFSRLLRIIVSSADKERAESYIDGVARIAMQIQEQHEELRVLGPAPAPLSRVKAEWRFHCLLKSTRPTTIATALRVLQENIPRAARVKIVFDVDPQEML